MRMHDTWVYYALHSNSLGEIPDLEFENHKNEEKKICFSHSNKMGQIYVKWDTKTKKLR